MSTEPIKVQLDFKMSSKIHTLYNSYFSYPPQGVVYQKSEFIIKPNFYPILKPILKGFRKTVSSVFPAFEQKVNDTLRKDSDFNLIHFANHIGKTSKPFVADYEHICAFVEHGKYYEQNRKNDAINLLSQKNLKFLLPFNHQSLKSFNLYFNDLGLDKIQRVVNPATFVPEEFRNNIQKKEKVIFIGTSNIATDDAFYIKGGHETLLAFERLSDEFKDVEFLVYSKVPEGLNIKQNDNFKINSTIPQKDLWNIMKEVKLFVQPNYTTPAMAYLEAMFFKMPIVTYDFWANSEYVENDNGILVNPKKIDIINEFNVPDINKEAIEKIRSNAVDNSLKIEDAVRKMLNTSNMEKMGENGFTKVTEGKFSISERNKKIKDIYSQAVG